MFVCLCDVISIQIYTEPFATMPIQCFNVFLTRSTIDYISATQNNSIRVKSARDGKKDPMRSVVTDFPRNVLAICRQNNRVTPHGDLTLLSLLTLDNGQNQTT